MAHYILLVSTDYTYMATDARVDSDYSAVRYCESSSKHLGELQQSIFVRRRASQAIGILLLIITFTIRDDGFRETIRYSLQGIALMPVFSAILLRPAERLSPGECLGLLLWCLLARLSYFDISISLACQNLGRSFRRSFASSSYRRLLGSL